MVEEFEFKFKLNENTIFENESWRLSIRPKQLTFCSMVLSIKSPISCFSQLTNKMLMDLKEIYALLAKIKTIIGADKINYISLMLVDDLLHTHIFFRHSKPIIEGGKVFDDKKYPLPLDISETSSIKSSDALNFISNTL